MLLAIHQQLSVARQAASAHEVRQVTFSCSKMHQLFSAQNETGVSDGQAGDDGNVKTLTVSIDDPQAIAHSNLPYDVTPWFTGYKCIPPEPRSPHSID
jgi:hypothetical protein